MGYDANQHHNTDPTQFRPVGNKAGHKSKVSGLNQSMDIGQGGYSEYHQNYVSFDKTENSSKPQHFRSGSQIVGGGQPPKGSKKNQALHQAYAPDGGHRTHQSQGELSQSQLAQLQQLQQQTQMSDLYSHKQSSERMQQKAKRKQNLSQNMPKNFEQSAKLLLPESHLMSAPLNQGPGHQSGVIQKLQQTFGGTQELLSSKRSYDHNGNEFSKGTKQQKQKPHNQSMQQPNMFDSARYNSISSLNQSANLHAGSISINQPGQITKERFQSTQKVGKKSGGKMVPGSGGSIVLPAGAGMQAGAQLKAQLNKGHLTHQNKTVTQLPLNSNPSISTQQFSNQVHQRMHSLPDSSSVGANMQRGFNSASNAAMQQQAQIMQIYQQNNAHNIASAQSTGSAKQSKFVNQGSNSRKVIPQLGSGGGVHHQRGHKQASRDRDSKQLVVDSYPSSNYQTYNQINYNTSGQLQGISNKKPSLADTSRVNRLASRENSTRRALVGGEMKQSQGDNSSSYNQTSVSIPQKKQMQTQKLGISHGHNASLHELSHQGSFNQTANGFFNEPSTSHSNALAQKNGSGQRERSSTKGAGGASQGGKHQKYASQYTPQLQGSMKHTINEAESQILTSKKSGPLPSQGHMRQASMQVGGDGSSHSKMSVQHRKNKSVLNNQIRINPSLQPNGNQGGKLRASGEHKLNQYFDNYNDHAHGNFYMQPAMSGAKTNLSATQNAHLLQNSAQNLNSATLKHNLSQSTHRKNKTSVIGGQQKMLGINSSSAFQHTSGLPTSLIAAESQPSSVMKKIVGGTISHSHKSLRSQSSTRARVASMDSSHALDRLGQNGKDQASKYSLPMGHNHSTYAKQGLGGAHSGHFTPDLSSYANGGLGSGKQKNSKPSHQGQAARQHLKPQGNIVIQQQHSNQNTAGPQKPAQSANRRHGSILKGEHQDKQMIYIDQDNVVSSKQAVAQRFGGSQPSAPRFVPNAGQGGVQSRDILNEQESLGSVSSLRATGLSFQDGGTGGGSQKPNQKPSSQLASDRQHEKSKPLGGFNSDKKVPAQFDRLVNPNDDYNLQRDFKKQQSAASKQNTAASGRHRRADDIDIDVAAIEVPDTVAAAKKGGAADKKQQKGAKSQGFSALRHQVGEEGDETLTQPLNRRGALQIEGLDLNGVDSINITQEALELGKVPPEEIADMIAASNFQLTENDKKLSPRAKEIVGISNAIRKSFQTKGEAPKTTPEFYRAGKMLGRGAFGKVSMGMHKLTRKLVALKSINKEYMTDQKQKSKVMHEVGILLRLRHQSVVKLYETFETKRHMLLAMELCAGGDLLNYVRKRKKLDEVSCKVIFRQIIQGLGYIHRKRILHRDIKLDNILLDGNGNVKIADFGVSKLVRPGDVMHEQSGTPAYIAPEILKEEGYAGFKADIWSAGVVLYAMLCGTVPFKASNMKELHKMIIKGKYHLKEEVTDGAKQLMRAMLETDPKKRISIAQILNHPWMQLPENCPEIFNDEEKEIVKREFIYNNPKLPNRSEAINKDVEPWDCFTELNLDSINQTLRNESEKSVILAPFNSSISDFNEEEYVGMEASLIIHRLFDDAAPLADKKATVRFAARCRDQDRQYEINNNGELDNGVYHKFVYSSRDGGPEPSSSMDDHRGGSVNDLRPQSSRNLNKGSDREMFKNEIQRHRKQGRDSETEDYGLEESTESMHGIGLPGSLGNETDESRVITLINFGYPEDYVRYCLLENEDNYCTASYYLLGEDQRY